MHDLNKLKEVFEDFKTLNDNWYDDTSLAPPIVLIDKVYEIIKTAIADYNCPPSFLFPLPEGGIVADWSIDHWQAEIEFLPDGNLTLFAYKTNSNEEIVELDCQWTLETPNLAQLIAEWINQLN
jgi:hypothetical protein